MEGDSTHKRPSLLPPPSQSFHLMKTSCSFLARLSRNFLRPTGSGSTSAYTSFQFQRTTRFHSTITHKMAAQSSLTERLNSLSLTIPQYPNCYPEVNPVDVYRAHLTSILTKVTGVDASIVYPALQWTQTLEKGDLVLPVPALRVKGKKPNELAEEWVAKVLSSCSTPHIVSG
jgi:hypothetical protein